MPAPPARRPTIVDVARVAGVSKSLVSAALRGDPGVSEASRQRVVETAASIGYRTNAWAQRLVSGRSDLVGVLLTDLRNAYHTDVVNGVEDAAGEAGFGVILSHGRRDAAVLRRRLVELVELGVDAVVVISAHLSEHDLATAGERVPLVVVGRPERVPAGVGWVANDDETGARLATEHLLDLGHERVAFLANSARPASLARRDSVRATLAAAGLEGTALEADERRDGIARILDAVGPPDGPTAVVAANDRLAARLLADAVDRGIDVPGSLAIVGYDNTELAALLRPGLTSVDQPLERMGRSAMAQLLAQLDGRAAERDVARPTLVVRGSTVPGASG